MRAVLRYISGKRANHSASDPRAAVARRIGHLIVGRRMHDKCAAISIIERARARRQAHAVSRKRNVSNTARGNDDVRIVASMRSAWILKAMLHTHRVVVATGRCECGTLALAGIVEVNAMGASRK